MLVGGLMERERSWLFGEEITDQGEGIKSDLRIRLQLSLVGSRVGLGLQS